MENNCYHQSVQLISVDLVKRNYCDRGRQVVSVLQSRNQANLGRVAAIGDYLVSLYPLE